MSQQVLEYQTPTEAPRRRSRRLIVNLALCVVGLIGLCSLEWSIGMGMDQITGATTLQTTYPFGIRGKVVVTPTLLDQRLAMMNLTIPRRWRGFSLITKKAFSTARGCGTVPPVYHFRAWMPTYLAIATDDEVRAFVDVMQSGTDAEQQAAIDAAVLKCEQTNTGTNSAAHR